MRLAFLGVLAAITSGSCSDEPDTATQVLVRFEADAAAAARAASLRVEITAVGDGEILFDERRAVPAEVTLPATVPVVPRDGDASRRFRVVGELSDATVTDEVGFVEGELREVTLTFVVGTGDGGMDDA